MEVSDNAFDGKCVASSRSRFRLVRFGRVLGEMRARRISRDHHGTWSDLWTPELGRMVRLAASIVKFVNTGMAS